MKEEKEKKKYYKRPEDMKRLNKSSKMKLSGSDCILDIFGYKKATHKHNLYYDTIFVDYYKPADFIKAFSPRSSFENALVIDPVFKKIKRKVEKEFGNTLLVMNYPTNFNSRKSNGIYIYLTTYQQEGFLEKDTFELHKLELENIVSFINKTIEDEFKYQETLDRSSEFRTQLIRS